MYIKEVPPIQEVTAFLKEVWDLNYNLEMNTQILSALYIRQMYSGNKELEDNAKHSM